MRYSADGLAAVDKLLGHLRLLSAELRLGAGDPAVGAGVRHAFTGALNKQVTLSVELLSLLGGWNVGVTDER